MRKNPNDCEECNNSSNPTPQKTNVSSEVKQNLETRIPGEIEEVKKELTEPEVCDEYDRYEWWTCDPDVACQATVGEQFLAWLKSLRDVFLPRTMNVADIVLVMSSPFGAVEDCPDGFCTNSYFDIRYTNTMIPGQDERNKYYFMTMCKAIIQGDYYDIPCAWDFTHLYTEEDFSDVDNIPTIEEGMTDDEYTDFLLSGEFCKRDKVLLY